MIGIKQHGNGDLIKQKQVNVMDKRTAINLLPYPYYNTSVTINGITFTDNGDGTITANGTATADAIFIFRDRSDNELRLPKGRYMLSGISGIGDDREAYFVSLAIGTKQSLGDYIVVNLTNWSTLFDLRELADDECLQLFVTIKSGTKVSNLVFKPMLEYGVVAHDYVPYIGADNFSDAINTLINQINELQQSVNNGKSLIASAITQKGIATAVPGKLF